MPAFIKTPADEARWAKAKKAASKTLSEGDGDKYWALTNSIYQKMNKSEEETIEQFATILEKVRRRMSDEQSEDDEGGSGPIAIEGDYDPEDFSTTRDYDPDEEEERSRKEEARLAAGEEPEDEQEETEEPDEGEDFLRENDPNYGKEENDYEEYGDDEDEDAHQKGVAEDVGEEPEATPQAAQEEVPEEKVKSSRFRQPSREEIVAMRQHTRPLEHRAREMGKLEAIPSKNPQLAHQGNLIEARNQSHGDRKSAYNQMTNSDAYKNADPIAQMDMDDKFEQDWRSKNPEHLKSAMKAHHQADIKGQEGKGKHAAEKEAQISNIVSGGTHNPDAYSTEEGLQHAGGIRGEEGTEGTIKHDPTNSFAMGNQDFLRQYAKDRALKGKTSSSPQDMENYGEQGKKDIGRILGPAPASDPKFNKFFEHYHPLIGMNASRTIKRLGLDPKSPDVDHDILREAGMHGLIQSINDYDHDNPSKASFATHAGNKIRGLQMTAMRGQDAIPTELRQAQKKFAAAKAPAVIKQSGHPGASDMMDRLQRINTSRETQQAKKISKPPTGGTSGNI